MWYALWSAAIQYSALDAQTNGITPERRLAHKYLGETIKAAAYASKRPLLVLHYCGGKGVAVLCTLGFKFLCRANSDMRDCDKADGPQMPCIVRNRPLCPVGFCGFRIREVSKSTVHPSRNLTLRFYPVTTSLAYSPKSGYLSCCSLDPLQGCHQRS